MRTSIILLVAVILFFCPASKADEEQIQVYSLPAFGYRAQVSADWTIHREEKLELVARVSFGLPRVWSDLEGQEIENAVSITAYRRFDITTLQEVIQCELDRIRDILVSSKEVELKQGPALLTETEVRGIKYRSLTTFGLRNGIAYVIGFTSTPGTYDRNVNKFKDFIQRVEFFTPEQESVVRHESWYEEARALYRGGSFNIRRVIDLLEDELSENSQNLKALKLLAISYTGVERFNDALETIDQTMAIANSISPRMLLLKVRVLHYLGSNKEAKQFLKAHWAFFEGDSALSSQRDGLLSLIETALSED